MHDRAIGGYRDEEEENNLIIKYERWLFIIYNNLYGIMLIYIFKI